MDVKVGHLPDPYKLDVAYCDGLPVGTVEKLVMAEPDPRSTRPIHQSGHAEFIPGRSV